MVGAYDYCTLLYTQVRWMQYVSRRISSAWPVGVARGVWGLSSKFHSVLLHLQVCQVETATADATRHTGESETQYDSPPAVHAAAPTQSADTAR